MHYLKKQHTACSTNTASLNLNNKPSDIKCRFFEPLAFALLVALLFGAAPVGAQTIPGLDLGSTKSTEANASDKGDENAQAKPDPLSPAAINERLTALQNQIATTDSTRPEKLDLINEWQSLLQTLQRNVSSEKTKQASAELNGDVKPAENPTVFALNETLEQVFLLQQQHSKHQERIEQQRKLLSERKDAAENAEKKRREQKRVSEAGAPQELINLELAVLRSRINAEKVNLESFALKELLSQQEEQAKQIQQLSAEADRLRAAIASLPEESQPDFTPLLKTEGRLQRQQEALNRELNSLRLRLQTEQARLGTGKGDATLNSIELLSLQVEVAEQELAMTEARLSRLPTLRQRWNAWHASLRPGTQRKQLLEWKEESQATTKELAAQLLKQTGRLNDTDKRLLNLNSKISADGADANARYESQQVSLQRLRESLQADIQRLEFEQRIAERLNARTRLRTLDFDLKEWLIKGWKQVVDIWRYEVTSVQDEAITVGSLFFALVLAGLGVMMSRRLSHWIGSFAEKRLKLDTGASVAIETLTFYILLVSFSLLALRSINFPLTAFTVLGGAFAIGLGFGSQNVMNNFISGLILMLERPVRAQDVVEVDGNHGVIQKIGARSTMIRSTDGRQIIVPNSFFLESNVVNWTLSDDLVRAKVCVGIAYGSPAARCKELLQKAAADNKDIIKSPAPIVLFEDFGDNALCFEVHFWVRARSPMQMRIISSDLRFAIDNAFKENDLTISFPQRDVHLDSASPIEIKWVGAPT